MEPATQQIKASLDALIAAMKDPRITREQLIRMISTQEVRK